MMPDAGQGKREEACDLLHESADVDEGARLSALDDGDFLPLGA